MFKKIFGYLSTLILFGLIGATAMPTSAQTCVPTPAKIAAWLPGDGNANDISGNSNNGTLQNGATFAAGKVAQAYSLDGTDDYVQVPASSSLDVGISNGLTIETWINPSNVSVQGPIVEWSANSNASGSI